MLKYLKSFGIALGFIALSAAVPVAAAESYFSGVVTHVSTNNIKVESSSNQTLSFLLVPHFDQVFQFDGKTTYQMKKIHPGTFVRVFYDQHFIGLRHADKIIVITRHGHVMKMGS